jgi:membrane-associated phospholipid phosphatase
MTWLSSFDQTLFRAINSGLSHPWLDRLMPFLSGNDFFFPLLLLCLGGLAWKGGARGRICALLLVLIVVLGDTFICTSIKDAVGRPRPFVDLADVNHLVGRGRHSSMPSNHAANWFAALVVLGTYYRRSLFFMLPLACAVGLSRIYNGVHYPSDVLAGAALGAAYAAITLHGLELAWSRFGARWLPLWHARFPSIRNPRVIQHDPAAATKEATPAAPIGLHWLRLGYLFIGALLVVRLGYIASDEIELSEDEAYQWVWSKHPALSYYSKPPLIALTQLAGTSLWGDIEFGVRFFSPLIAAAISLLLLRFFAREVNARAGFWLITIVSTTPLLAVGATLMTVDPLSVLFWTCAMVWGWRAIQPDADWRPWAAVGLWMGLGFLSKYTNLIQ